MSVTSELSSDENMLTISIQGAFDFSVVHEFRNSYSEIDNNDLKVVIDFRDTIHMDSSALGMLLNLKRHIGANDKEVKIINARRDVKKILLIAHFEKAFDIS